MRVCVQLRNGLSYVTGLGYLRETPVYLVFGELVDERLQDAPARERFASSIRIRPSEIVFQNPEGEEMVRDVSSLGETWSIPFTNIDYVTMNETSPTNREIRGLMWRVAYLENMSDQEADKGLKITGRKQQLNLLRAKLEKLAHGSDHVA